MNVNETVIFNSQIYAATETGIFNADISNPLLIDFNNWQQNFSGRNFKKIKLFNNQLITVENNSIFSINGTALTLIRDFTENVVSIKTSNSHLSIAFPTSGLILNTAYNQIFQSIANSEYNFTLNNVLFDNNRIFLATKEFGILSTTQNQSVLYTEIHPEGPLSNSSFSITSRNNN